MLISTDLYHHSPPHPILDKACGFRDSLYLSIKTSQSRRCRRIGLLRSQVFRKLGSALLYVLDDWELAVVGRVNIPRCRVNCHSISDKPCCWQNFALGNVWLLIEQPRYEHHHPVGLGNWRFTSVLSISVSFYALLLFNMSCQCDLMINAVVCWHGWRRLFKA